MKFTTYNPTAPTRLWACIACQKDVRFLTDEAFGISTLLALCATCVAAVVKKWPAAFEEKR